MKYCALPEPRVNTPVNDTWHREIVTKMDADYLQTLYLLTRCATAWMDWEYGHGLFEGVNHYIERAQMDYTAILHVSWTDIYPIVKSRIESWP
jgi:hypothetical protein